MATVRIFVGGDVVDTEAVPAAKVTVQTGIKGDPGPSLITVNSTATSGFTAGYLLSSDGSGKVQQVNPATYTYTADSEITIAANAIRVHQPNSFSFTNVTDAVAATLITSNSITVGGSARHYPVSVSGDGSPEISINGGTWTTGRVPAAIARPGDTVQVRLTAGASLATRTATVRIGETSTVWSVTSSAFNPAYFGSDLVIAADVGLSRSQSKLWQDAGKTTLATAVGHPVRVMQCPYTGLEWVSPSDSARPTLQQNGAGKWYLLPDGIDDRLSVTASGSSLHNVDFEWHFAINGTESSISQTKTTLGLLSTSRSSDDQGVHNLDCRYSLYGNVAHITPSYSRGTGFGVDGWQRVVSGNAWTSWFNGASAATGTATPTWTAQSGNNDARVFTLGNGRLVWLPHFYGLCAVRRVMTTTERSNIVAFLQGLYT